MRILLIDNGTGYLHHLSEALDEHDLTIVELNDLQHADPAAHDLIVLSGGHKYSLTSQRRRYRREIKMIKESARPILGICLGFELIAITFGAKLVLLRKRIHGEAEVDFVDEGFTIRGKRKVYESHRRGIRRVPRELIVVASSEYGVEAVRHRERPIYGFQFHPEKTGDAELREAVFGELISTLTRV